jgi:Xaa-Pro aminopeptidase
LVVKKENLFYFSGQRFIDGYLLVGKSQAVYFGNGLEKIDGAKAALIGDMHKFVKPGQTLEVEDCVSVEEWNYLKKKLKGVKLVASSGVVERLRAVKSKPELADLEQAYRITAKVFDTVKSQLRKKQWTEEGLASYIRIWGLELGAEDVSFEPIVAAGPNAAIPHHRPGMKVLKQSESIVLDFGFKVNGYCSDFTRTVFLGKAPTKLKLAYEATERAYNEAVASARAGMSGGELDQVARGVLREEKMHQHFIHSLGHGTGLEVHELPHVSPGSPMKLEDGMVFSVEPGVYLPGIGGVRIEDLVYLEKGAVKYFVKVPTSLKENII